MPLSKRKQAEWMREHRRRMKQKTLFQAMSRTDIRAMRAAGLNPEEIGNETGTVPSSQFYALLRDRNAIKAHLSWHHEQVGKPDIGTIVEQMQEQIKVLQFRVTQLEAGEVLHEARRLYQYSGGEEDNEDL